MKLGCFVIIIFVLFVVFAIMFNSNHDPPKEDKAGKIAAWIQEKVNSDGFTGCQTRVIVPGDPGVIRCDLYFPAGTSSYTVKANTKGVAELFAQVGRIAATIYYTGYSGAQKVCEYEYDCYSGRVEEKF